MNKIAYTAAVTTIFCQKLTSPPLWSRKFFKEDWSPDACIGFALKEMLFIREQIVCTKTLYGDVDLGLIGIKNIDLPEKLRLSPKEQKSRENKRVLGRSIEERPAEVNDRAEFGYREADLVIGSKKCVTMPCSL